MSKLTGHWQITKEAVKELKNPTSAAIHGGGNTIALSRLHAQDLATAVIVRDLVDVANGGHWGNYGQSHHFMRKFNGQSQFEAYQDGVHWIQKNALVASKKLYKVIIASKAAAEKRQRPEPAFWVEELGFACHAMQDSFAEGHARREQATTANTPGRIAEC